MSYVFQFVKSYATELAELLFILVSFVVSLVSAIKKKRVQELIKVLNKIPSYISQIESIFPNGFGTCKLGYVLGQVERFCKLNHIEFDEAYFTKYIESILATPTKDKNLIKGGDENAQSKDC